MKLFQVDSFTTEQFKGNPAGVCITDHPLSETLMQNIASEMALSETAFLVKQNTGNTYSIRFFTPTTEVSLCGHATLAAAHILWETKSATDKITFKGNLYTLVAGLNNNASITIVLPPLYGQTLTAEPTDILKTNTPNLEPSDILHYWKVCNEKGEDIKLIIEVANDLLVKNFIPNLAIINNLPFEEGLIITAKSTDAKYDIISRYFAPKIGIPEDPVTGAAHCALAIYWESKLGRKLRAFQASKRGGSLGVERKDDFIELTGRAITIFDINYVER